MTSRRHSSNIAMPRKCISRTNLIRKLRLTVNWEPNRIYYGYQPKTIRQKNMLSLEPLRACE